MSFSALKNLITKASKGPDVTDPSSLLKDQFCHTCTDFDRMIKHLCSKKKKSSHLKFGTKESVEKSSSTCAFCKFMVETPGWDTCWETNGNLFLSKFNDRSKDGVQSLMIASYFTEDFAGPVIPYVVLLAVFADEDSPAAIARHVSGRPIKPAANLKFAKSCLSSCLRNHDHGTNTASRRPSRLVAVGTEDGASRIVLVDNSTTDKEFVALSHCWGQASITRTTRATLGIFRNSISWDQLSKTFQDAIQVTRALGFKYIWIDSLCIVQDDSEDWAAESAKMADIFNSAIVTIMAASSLNSSGGCFWNRPPNHTMTRLPYTDKAGKTRLCVCVSTPSQGYEAVVDDGPLFLRAWVFQERLLSKRKLIFGEDQTYWDCDGSIQSESRREERAGTVRNTHFRFFAEPHMQAFEDRIDASDPSAWRHLWQHLVETYSRCSLTYETDVLPSLGGLARRFAQKSSHTYAAGMWLEQMPYSLLWFPQVPMSEDQERQYCAPSWSWASVRGRCSYDGSFTCEQGVELEILGMNIRLASVDSYGRVTPGSNLVVKGRLRSAQLVGDPPKININNGDQFRLPHLDQEAKDLPLTIFCLEIFSGYPYGEIFEGEYHHGAQCILLEDTENKTEFRRVGHTELEPILRSEDYFFFGIGLTIITLV